MSAISCTILAISAALKSRPQLVDFLDDGEVRTLGAPVATASSLLSPWVDDSLRRLLLGGSQRFWEYKYPAAAEKFLDNLLRSHKPLIMNWFKAKCQGLGLASISEARASACVSIYSRMLVSLPF